MKRPADLPESLSRRLNSYALAASVAGVSRLDNAMLIGTVAAATAGLGLLAGVPAHAKVVYTPTAITISTYLLDLNKDGKADFRFSQYPSHGYTTSGSLLRISGHNVGNGIWRKGQVGLSRWNPPCAAALHAGVKVGPRGPFDAARLYMAGAIHHRRLRTYQYYCPWANGGKGVLDRYLGLKFYINGKVHFGWARLSVTVLDKYALDALLTGYAYETVANKPIVAGKTKGPDVVTLQDPSLGHLARGASAIPAWRGNPK